MLTKIKCYSWSQLFLLEFFMWNPWLTTTRLSRLVHVSIFMFSSFINNAWLYWIYLYHIYCYHVLTSKTPSYNLIQGTRYWIGWMPDVSRWPGRPWLWPLTEATQLPLASDAYNTSYVTIAVWDWEITTKPKWCAKHKFLCTTRIYVQSFIKLFNTDCKL